MEAHPLSGTPRLPLGFAHRGGRLDGQPPNTLGAFTGALAAGARGLESDVWMTADGLPVLLHPRVWFRNGIGSNVRADLPAHVPTVDELYDACGTDFDLAVDMAAPPAAPTVVEIARRHHASDRLWLTYWNVTTLAAWRRRWPDVRLVFPTAVLPWRRNHDLLDRLAAAGVDALNLHHRQVSPRIAEAAHRRGLLLLAWGLRGGANRVAQVLGAGADGVFVDDVPAMLRGLAGHRFARNGSPARGREPA